MSEKGQVRKSMFSVQNMEELGRLYESDTPVLAYDFKRRMVEGWTPEHSHHRGQLVTDAGVADRGNRKRTMAVSLPALRMDSTKL